MQSEIKNQEIMSRKPFVKMALMISIPIIVQNLMATLVGAVDTLMLGYVSQEAMTAAALAVQIQNVLLQLFYGLTCGVTVLTSQYWGRNDRHTIERVMGIGVRIALAISLVFFAAAELSPRLIMRIFTSEEAILREGVVYLRVLAVSWLFTAFSQIYVSVQRSVERVILPTITYIVSLGLNVAINAVFIFGLFGAPRLGLKGVALGTVIARAAEAAVCLIHSRITGSVRFRVSLLFVRAGTLAKDIRRITVPVLINDMVYSLGGMVYAVILGHLGSDVVAANAIAVLGQNFAAVLSRGVSNATSIIIGKSLGANQMSATKVYARRMSILSIIFGAASAALILLIRPQLLAIYSGKLSEAALTLTGAFLIMQMLRIFAEAINTCWNCGCFRAGGDARFGAIVDGISLWAVMLPVAAILAFVFKVPAMGVFFFLCLDEMIKVPIYYQHYRQYGWMRNMTREEP